MSKAANPKKPRTQAYWARHRRLKCQCGGYWFPHRRGSGTCYQRAWCEKVRRLLIKRGADPLDVPGVPYAPDSSPPF